MWLRRLRGAIGMGLTWALGWAVAGMLIGVTSKITPFLPWDLFFQVFDAPLPAMAIPGFFAGAFFSLVLGVAGRGRKFSELSLPRFTAWGAVGGLLLTLFPFALVAVGLADLNPGYSLSRMVAVMAGLFIPLSAASAWGMLKLARVSEKRDALEPSHDAAVR